MATPTQGSSSSRRPRDPASGEMDIGGFRRKEEIGRGSFATVYRGAHVKKRGAVAIKSVNLSKLVNKKLKDNLFGEIKILKELHHPHIVSLIDCVEAPSHIHLVMEYCQLGDLSNFIKRRDSWIHKTCTTGMMQKYPNPPVGGLNEVVVRHFLQQLASALEFLRKEDLIHRDVKPQNLLLNPSPMYFTKAGKETMPFTPSENSLIPIAGIESLPMLKIADFGFARSLPATSLAETLCGSPLYMAPEILRYERYDAKADLWSVGTVLFEMMVGKPPFRASNHVELLRKIEKGEDRIKFADDVRISDAMKKLIRGLLRRNPVERMGFNDFFQNTVVRDDIPGLVGEDMPRQTEEQQALPKVVSSAFQETRHSSSETRADAADGQARPYRQPSTGSNDGSARPKAAPRTSTEHHTSSTASRRQPVIGSPISEEPRRRTRTDGSDSPEIFHDAEERVPPRRPSIVSHPTAPARPDLPTRQAQRSTGMKRTSIEQTPPSPTRTTSNFSPTALERVRRQSEEKAAREREERERIAANEVAFERDYVVVEKRAVEVNALADELAASPMVQGLKQQKEATSAMANKEPSAQIAPLTNLTSNDTRGALVKRTGQHIRKESFERRSRPFPSTSYITKAMNAASGRLMSFGYSPPFGTARGPSPPSYSPFPSYPIAEGSILLINDGVKPAGTLDEDAKLLYVIEEIATRSDVVYGFAEVKYKQLIPLAPSTQHGLGIRPQAEISPNGASSDVDESGLTVDAIVTLSEEALVLYVKALSLLAKTMDIAGAWWARKNRGEAAVEDPPLSPRTVPGAATSQNPMIGHRFNGVVQWIRSRFNEVLEKAEFVRLKLVQAQQKLPLDHPSHPSNYPSASTSSTALGGSRDQVIVSPGVTAEKLMYNRALEMSRAAAVNELCGEELKDCEMAYLTAIRLLEAVLEGEGSGEDGGKAGGAGGRTGAGEEGEEEYNPIQAEDRENVAKMIQSIKVRLAAARKKLRVIASRGVPPVAPAPSKSPVLPQGAVMPSVAGTPPR